jgi:hypothetical protein
MPTPEHLVVSLSTKEVEDFLNEKATEWDPLMASPYQIGSGYGSRIEVLLILRKRLAIEGNGNGGQHRRAMMPVIPAKKKKKLLTSGTIP